MVTCNWTASTSISADGRGRTSDVSTSPSAQFSKARDTTERTTERTWIRHVHPCSPTHVVASLTARKQTLHPTLKTRRFLKEVLLVLKNLPFLVKSSIGVLSSDLGLGHPEPPLRRGSTQKSAGNSRHGSDHCAIRTDLKSLRPFAFSFSKTGT